MTLPCDRCGQLAEEPAELVGVLDGVPDGAVLVCLECMGLWFADRARFYADGWQEQEL